MFQRVWRFTRFGLFIGTVLAAWICVLMIVQGSLTIELRGGSRVFGPTVVLTYLIGGAGGGAVTGLLLPLHKSFLGSMLVGIVALIPLGLGVFSVLSGFALGEDELLALAIFCIVLGSILGPAYRKLFSEDQ